jgi:ankyrin repeat protein
VKYLIERGAQIDIFAAAQQNMIDVIRKWVEADADVVHAAGPDGQRALHFACSREVIDYLLEKGANIHARDIDHRATAAQWMVGDRRLLCHYLIDRGAEPDIFMVCALGDTDLVRSLLDADPDVVNKRIGQPDYPPVSLAPGLHIYVYTFGDNKSPHQIAHQHGHQSVYELLLERSSTQRRFIAACEVGDSNTAQLLLRGEPKIGEMLGYQDQRLLADAAWENNLEAVRVMLEAGFNTHVPGAEASTPLDRAAFHGFSDLVKLLLKYNPPLTLQNQYGASPLDSAIYGSVHSWRQEGDFPATVEALIQAGSKVNPTAVPSGNEAVDAVLRRYLNNS